LKIRHGATVDNVVPYYVYVKFDDERCWSERAFGLTRRRRRRTLVAIWILGPVFQVQKIGHIYVCLYFCYNL